MALLIIPTALFILGIVLVNAQGPWGSNGRFDPEYNYLLNALSLLTFHVPGHTDHPGTTVQEFGSGIVFGKWIAASLTGGWTSIQRAVLSHPDDYLMAINFGIRVAIFAAVFFTGLRLYTASGSLLAGLTLQISLLFFHQTFIALPRVSPEPFLIAVGFALMIPLIPLLLGQERDPARASATAGAIFGFGVITKVTFIPLAAVAALVGGPKERKRFAVASLASAFLFALPILPKTLRVAHWYTSLLIHSERYGRGPVGLPAAADWLDHLSELRGEEPFVFYALLYYLLMLVALRFAKRDRLTQSTERLLGVVCVALVIQLAMTLKHYAAHYMLPSLVLCALLNAFLVLWLSSPALPAVLRRTLAALGAGLICLGLWSFQGGVRGWITAAAENLKNTKTLADVRQAATGCFVIGYYGSSSPSYALAYGSSYTAGVHARTLEELYPNFIFFDQFAYGFRGWNLEPRIIQVRRMIADGQCVLLDGLRSDDIPAILEPEFSLQPVAQAGWEVILRLGPGTQQRVGSAENGDRRR